MTNAKEIADSLGRDEIAARVGVRRTAVDQAVRSGKLPAAWYMALAKMTDAGNLPASAFTFKGIAAE